MTVVGFVRPGMLAALAVGLALVAAPVSAETAAGPRFRAGGPDAAAYGQAEGYPVCRAFDYVRKLGCRVGAFSHYDELFPARTVAAPERASPLSRADSAPSIEYEHAGKKRTLAGYLDRRPVTGFLIAKDDTILLERYQYARHDRHRLTSFSMAKTVLGLLIGLAIEDGAIASIDDPAETYVPGLKGSEYGRTPIKALLQMASGVTFREVYYDASSDIARLAVAALGQEPGGSLSVLKTFRDRHAEPGRTFRYSSAESNVLGLVLTGATGRTVADYASETLWGPLGAEAHASWNIDATGQEVTFAYFNAVLRDWARLGLMLAHGGTWQGRSVVPRAWVIAATTAGDDAPSPGYGYQVWLPFTKQRTVVLRGLRGQYVLINPETKIVLVQTSLASDGLAYQELLALWSALLDQLK